MKLTAIMMSLFAVVLTVNATAATSSSSDMEQHEILINANRAVGGGISFGGAPTGGNSTTAFGLQGGYLYQFMPGLQVGLTNFGITQSSSNGNSTTNWDFMAGININWPMSEKLENAMFLTLEAGLKHNPASTTVVGATTVTTDSSNNFQWGAEVGKRFTLADHVNYRPSVQILKQKDTSMQVLINVVAFSATF